MSRNERLRAQERFERDRQRHERERPGEPAHRFDSDPRSWASWCPGWKGGVHERARQVEGEQWRCRWCWQWFEPPAPKGMP